MKEFSLSLSIWETNQNDNEVPPHIKILNTSIKLKTSVDRNVLKKESSPTAGENAPSMENNKKISQKSLNWAPI